MMENTGTEILSAVVKSSGWCKGIGYKVKRELLVGAEKFSILIMMMVMFVSIC